MRIDGQFSSQVQIICMGFAHVFDVFQPHSPTRHPAEYNKAYYAVKKAEKLAQAAKGTAAVFKKSEKVRGPAIDSWE